MRSKGNRPGSAGLGAAAAAAGGTGKVRQPSRSA